MAQSKVVTIPLHYRLLAGYMQQLGEHPLRTRMITAAVFQTIEENVAVRVVNRPLDTNRLGKLIIYGLAIGGPLSHITTKLLTNVMAATGTRASLHIRSRNTSLIGCVVIVLGVGHRFTR